MRNKKLPSNIHFDQNYFKVSRNGTANTKNGKSEVNRLVLEVNI